MNTGDQRQLGSIFLVRCADFKCLAVRGADGRWKSFHDDAKMSGEVEPLVSFPVELILPFLSQRKREQLLSIPVPVQR